jgi:hypothetical protein
MNNTDMAPGYLENVGDENIVDTDYYGAMDDTNDASQSANAFRR